MHLEQKTIVWFNEVSKKDVLTVGGKGANLGEMTQAHIPVPPGFIVTANTYHDFLQRSKLTDKIYNLLKPLNPNNSKQLQQIATKIQQVILSAPMPPELARGINEAYVKLGGADHYRHAFNYLCIASENAPLAYEPEHKIERFRGFQFAKGEEVTLCQTYH